MKILILIFFAATIYLSEQKFVYFDPNKNEPIQPFDAANGSRFIVNVVEYSFVNNTRTANKFKCLGSLISEEFVITTAHCVQKPEKSHIGIQFETIRDDTNDVGYSITFDETTVRTHENYTNDNEAYNIALIKIDPKSITTSPPLFSIFKPKHLGAIPRVADYCNVIGRNVQLSSPPQDKVFVIGPSSCFGSGGKQPYCSMFNDSNADACKVLEGAPVICKDNEIAGIVLGGPGGCVKSGSSYQLRYHSVGDFEKFLIYFSVGPTTTKPNSAAIYKLSLSALLVVLVHYMVKA